MPQKTWRSLMHFEHNGPSAGSSFRYCTSIQSSPSSLLSAPDSSRVPCERMCAATVCARVCTTFSMKLSTSPEPGAGSSYAALLFSLFFDKFPWFLRLKFPRWCLGLVILVLPCQPASWKCGQIYLSDDRFCLGGCQTVELLISWSSYRRRDRCFCIDSACSAS